MTEKKIILSKEDKINIILFGIILIYSVIYIIFRNDFIIDFIFVALLVLLGSVGIISICDFYKDTHINYKFVLFVFYIFAISIFVYKYSYNKYEDAIFVDFVSFLLAQFLLIFFFISKLILRKSENIKFEIIFFFVSISLLVLSIVSLGFMLMMKVQDKFYLGYSYLLPLLLVPLLYVFSTIQKEQQEIQQRDQRIKNLKELYKNNPAFYIHKIKNKLLSLQFLIKTEDIKSDLKEDIEDYLGQIQDTIDEFYQFDELNRRQSFLLKDFISSFEFLHKTDLKRKKIKFEIISKDISPEIIVINIPFNIFHTIIEILFDNSVYALQNIEMKRIEIVLLKNNDNLFIEFCDTGVGVENKFEQKIFEYGYSTKKEGKGIGLSQVRSILDTFNGKISYKGTLKNFNSVFELQIPIK